MSVEWVHNWMDDDGATRSTLAFGAAISGQPTLRLTVGDQWTILSIEEAEDLMLVAGRLIRRSKGAVRQVTEQESKP